MRCNWLADSTSTSDLPVLLANGMSDRLSRSSVWATRTPAVEDTRMLCLGPEPLRRLNTTIQAEVFIT